MRASRSRVRVVLVTALSVLGILAVLFASWMFVAMQQGGLMAGFVRSLGIAAAAVGVLTFGIAIVLWRR